MKLLYIANIRIPTEKAHGHQIMTMGEAFSLQGVDTILVVPSRKNNDFKNVNPFDFYEIKKNFKLKKILTIDPVLLLKFPAGIYIKVQSIIFMFFLSWYFLFINRGDYTVYTRDEYLLPFLQIFFKRVVWEAHALPNNLNKYRKYLNRCYKVIVLTSEIKKQLTKLGINGNKVLVSPDAVDLSIFDIDIDKQEARQSLKLPANKILLGYTGSFKTKDMDKGISDILKALKKLPDNILLVAIGGSDIDIEFYKNIAKSLNIENRVIWVKKVDQKTLAVYQKSFDVLLMPFPYTKHYAYYMSPLKMFEYMASKRPIVASNLPTIKEVLNENNCIFCRPDDNADLANKINILISNSDLAAKLSNQAYLDVKNYTWNNRAKLIIDFIS